MNKEVLDNEMLNGIDKVAAFQIFQALNAKVVKGNIFLVYADISRASKSDQTPYRVEATGATLGEAVENFAQSVYSYI